MLVQAYILLTTFSREQGLQWSFCILVVLHIVEQENADINTQRNNIQELVNHEFSPLVAENSVQVVRSPSVQQALLTH